jgi:hypothetical protein
MILETNMRRLTMILLLMVLSLALALTACGGAANGGAGNGGDEGQSEADDHAEGDGHADDAEHHDEAAIPNNGAVIRIISPEDGAVFNAADEVLIQVQVENFALGEDGNHWHVHLDEGSEIMVMGGNTDQPLRNLTPGEHTIEVMLSNGDHQNLEEGDSVTITVEE